MPIYTDGTIPRIKITLPTDSEKKFVFLEDGGAWCEIKIGDNYASVRVQDLLNAARLLGAKDITAEISTP